MSHPIRSNSDTLNETPCDFIYFHNPWETASNSAYTVIHLGGKHFIFLNRQLLEVIRLIFPESSTKTQRCRR